MNRCHWEHLGCVVVAGKRRPLAEKFEERVERGPHEACWLWRGSFYGNGYGRLGHGPDVLLAHRVSYELHVGPIPDGLTIDHLCRVPACVNPAHLEAVTFRENVLRGVSPPAQGARRTECPAGHPYTPDNLKTYKGCRGRMCLTCAREHQRRTWQRHGAKYNARAKAKRDALPLEERERRLQVRRDRYAKRVRS